MEIVCTICSRKKDPRPGPLPARERYLGDHIPKVAAKAKKKKRQLFFLSGKFGLLHESDPVKYYDYLLVQDDVDKLVAKVVDEIHNRGIRSIHFYYEEKPSWLPYLEVMQRATTRARALLTPVVMP